MGHQKIYGSDNTIEDDEDLHITFQKNKIYTFVSFEKEYFSYSKSDNKEALRVYMGMKYVT